MSELYLELPLNEPNYAEVACILVNYMMTTTRVWIG